MTKFLTDLSSMSWLTILVIIVAFIFIISNWINVKPIKFMSSSIKFIAGLFSKFISNKENKYRRDIEVGKIDEKRRRVKTYKFLSELILDLGLKDTGVTPYEFMYLVLIITAVSDALLCKILFNTFLTAMFMYPIAALGAFCFLYTRANIAHDKRIEDVIDSENIICNAMRSSVVTAVEESLEVLPRQLKNDYKDFIDDVKQKNTYIKTALLALNAKLGSVSDDFIKKCINFELEEEHGMVGIFTEIVETNNIKRTERIRIKNKLDMQVTTIKICASMIYLFLLAVLIVYPSVRNGYFNTIFGQILIGVDILLMIVIYVIITWIRAQDL